MSRLTVVAITTAVSMMIAGAASAADETAATLRSRPPGRWTIDGRVGYSAAWSTGISSLGVGEGLAIGRTWPSRLHLEVQGFRYAGAAVNAGNQALVYRAAYTSTVVQAGAGYDFAIGAVHVRPSMLSGLSWIDGRTTVGNATLRDEITRWRVGPSLTTFVEISRFVIGVDAQAFFVPSTVASPTLGIYGLVGIAL